MTAYTLQQTTPDRIEFDDDHLRIYWKDGSLSEFNVLELRKKCPCAYCRGGHGGKAGAATEHIEEAKIVSWTKVGRYAINLVFQDYHKNGIYAYDRLRQFADGDENAFD